MADEPHAFEHLSDAAHPTVQRIIEQHPEHMEKINMERAGAVEYLVSKEAEAARDLLAELGDLAEGDEGLAADMVEGETGLNEALEQAVSEIRECDVIAQGCKAEVEILASRRTRAEARKDKIRAAIEQAMIVSGLDTVRLPTKTLTVAHRAGKLVVTEEADIPAEFWKPQSPKLDKAALTKALEGQIIPGAHMSNGSVSLTIRSK